MIEQGWGLLSSKSGCGEVGSPRGLGLGFRFWDLNPKAQKRNPGYRGFVFAVGLWRRAWHVSLGNRVVRSANEQILL